MQARCGHVKKPTQLKLSSALLEQVDADAVRSTTGLCLANGDVATHPLNVLQVVDRRGFVSLVYKVDESETTLAAGVPVEGQGALADFAVLTKQVDEVVTLSVPGQVADENCQKTNALWVILARRLSPPKGDNQSGAALEAERKVLGLASGVAINQSTEADLMGNS